MTKRIANGLLLAAALFQVACGKSKKDAALDQFLAQCQNKPCTDMYATAARNAGIVGPAAAAALPQVATVGAPVLPGQVTNTTILPASVSDKQIAATQAKIASQLQAIVAQQPSSSTATSSSSTMQAASVASGGASSVAVGVTRLPSSDVAPAEPANQTSPALQLTSATGAFQPASVDNGSAFGAEVSAGSGAGR